MRGFLALLALMLLPVTAQAQDLAQDEPAVAANDLQEAVVLGLSQNRVRITANFDGSEILIFGAVKRDGAVPDSELDVIIAVAGPSAPLVVRKKERRYGIWINTESADLHSAPSFYSVSSSRPLKDILPEAVDEEFQITAPQMVQGLGSEQNFVDATIRIRENAGLYQVDEGSIEVSEQTLFRTSVDMPANLTEGDYRTRVFLLRDQTIISDFETIIDVRKVGLERFLFNLSRERPLIYGLLSLAIAIAAGWGASAAFRVFKAG